MESITALIDNLDTPDEVDRRIAIINLGEMGACAVGRLREALSDSRPLVRSGAALALGKLGSCAVGALDDLIQRLGDPSVDVQRAAESSLTLIGTDSVSALVAALEQPNPRIRGGAASALGGLGTGAKMAAPSLSRLLCDEDDYVHLQVAAALGVLMADDAKSLAAMLTKAIHDGITRAAEGLVIALRQCNSNHDDIVRALHHAFIDRQKTKVLETLL